MRLVPSVSQTSVVAAAVVVVDVGAVAAGPS